MFTIKVRPEHQKSTVIYRSGQEVKQYEDTFIRDEQFVGRVYLDST